MRARIWVFDCHEAAPVPVREYQDLKQANTTADCANYGAKAFGPPVRVYWVQVL
ncbi:hypothetical protein [Burkholderia cepacia]|uniref:hypothetical protein n=1 Tax=Burkholderia cepacia TaxID=292 RepID=UPI0012DAC171|nr:hypothetical protein [Burkholderia cepacia]